MSRSKKRIFIADPSFQDWIGHHAPYDLAVQSGIIEKGAEAIIFANKAIAISGEMKYVDKVFSSTAWGNKTSEYKLKLSHSFLMVIYFSLKGFLGFPIICCRFLKKMIWVMRRIMVIRFIWNWLFPPLVTFLWRWGKKTIKDAIRDTSMILVKTLQECSLPHWIVWLISRRQHLRDYYELLAALKKYKFGDGDTVFVHMITDASLPVWGLFASWISNKKKKGKAVLLFRYTYYWMSNTWRTKMYFLAIETAFMRGYVTGATDSSLLAKEYAQFVALPLVVYPIPHIPQTVPEKSAVKENLPLRCVSLGNARAEKGIVEIINAIKLINEKDLSNKFSFGLQLNDPDDDCAGAVEQLIQDLPSNVDIYTSALTPQEYESLINTSDVVLTPYWNEIYFSRTSGVMLEALVAGKIIVTTGGTWMAEEMHRYEGAGEIVQNKDATSIAESLTKILEKKSEYSEKALAAAKRARAFHNPHAFADILLNGSIKKKILEADPILICFPWGDLSVGKSGASRRALDLNKIYNNYKITFFSPDQEKEADTLKIVTYPYDQDNNIYKKLSTLFCYFDKKAPPVIYWFHQFDNSRSFRLKILKLLLENKAVIVEYPFYIKQIAPFAKALGLPIGLTFLDRFAMNCRNKIHRSIINRMERNAAQLADVVFTVEKSEYDYFLKMGVNAVLSPISYDFSGLAMDMEEAKRIIPAEIGNFGEFLFFAGGEHTPNVEAKRMIKEIAVQSKNKNLPWKFVVAGSCGNPEETKDNFITLGMVSNKLLAVLYIQCRMVISPLPYGTGASVKTLEAMGAGKVILGSHATFRGLKVSDGVECFIEDDPEKYISRLEFLLSDASKKILDNVALRAKEFVKQYDYKICLKPYVDFLETWPNI